MSSRAVAYGLLFSFILWALIITTANQLFWM
jgi:hypothetical protein